MTQTARLSLLELNKKYEKDARDKNKVELDYAKRLICPSCKGCKNIIWKGRNLPQVKDKIMKYDSFLQKNRTELNSKEF